MSKLVPGLIQFLCDPDDDEQPELLGQLPLPDQRAVMADIPEGATRVIVVAPVFVRRRKRKLRFPNITHS